MVHRTKRDRESARRHFYRAEFHNSTGFQKHCNPHRIHTCRNNRVLSRNPQCHVAFSATCRFLYCTKSKDFGIAQQAKDKPRLFQLSVGIRDMRPPNQLSTRPMQLFYVTCRIHATSRSQFPAHNRRGSTCNCICKRRRCWRNRMRPKHIELACPDERLRRVC